jgi:hypothetical protein
MHIYQQSTGRWTHNGNLIGVGYSGHGPGLNDPAMEQVPDVGPISVGHWVIGSFFTDPDKGPIVAHLTPQPGTDTYGRNGFMLHGDNEAMDHTASLGCIIMSHSIRLYVSQSGDTQLAVVS